MPVASYSASRAVISPSMSGCGLGVASLATDTFTLEPIFAPDLVMTSRSGSRNRSRKKSGSRRLSSTTAETSSALASAASGEPSMSTRKLEEVGAIQFTGSISAAVNSDADGSISVLPSGNRPGSSTRLKCASERHRVGSPYSR